jgi:sulfide:quinone oxidoreductase
MTRVLIAGSGVAAVEAALALHALAGDRVELELLAPAAELNERPWSVLTPFGGEPAPRIDLTRLVSDLGLRRHHDSLEAVDRDAHTVLTRGGDRVPYDVLVVATGARSREAVPGAVTFRGPPSTGALEGVLARAARDPKVRLVFTAPRGARWLLPLYELALLSAARLRELGIAEPDIAVATPEPEPLAALGAAAAAAVRAAFDDYDVQVITDSEPSSAVAGALQLRGGGLVRADVVIALPELVGPRITGLPCDDDGYLPADLYGRVRGCDDVFAAGDATSFEIKHGGLAAQQADAAAECIAARVGAIASAEAFHPTVRAMLLAGDTPLYITADLAARDGVVSREPLWAPLDKIAGRYLSPYLASGEATGAKLKDRAVTPRPGR